MHSCSERSEVKPELNLCSCKEEYLLSYTAHEIKKKVFQYTSNYFTAKERIFVSNRYIKEARTKIVSQEIS